MPGSTAHDVRLSIRIRTCTVIVGVRSNVRGDLGASLTNEPLSRSRGSVDRTDRGAARSLAGVPSGDWRRRHTADGQPHLISSSPGVQQARGPNAEPCVVQRRDRRVTPAETAILAL
jgi:hypothetical protein